MDTPTAVGTVRIIGGNIALDLINTRSGPAGGAPDSEYLHGYPDLVAWAERVGLLTAPETARLIDRARRRSAAAGAAYQATITLREHLDGVFIPLARGQDPSRPALAALRSAAADALTHAELVVDDDHFRWNWAPDDDDLAWPLRPVPAAAVRLLTEGPLSRVKGCASCRFLFLDASKNGSRRWCSMDDCGRSDKHRRFVARRAAGRRAGEG